MNDLTKNIDKIHTTTLGAMRINRNLDLDVDDVVDWCKTKIGQSDEIIRKGKNWYVYVDNIVITVNAHSYTIITAHKSKAKKEESDMGVLLKEIAVSEYSYLEDFLYNAIFLAPGEEAPPREIIFEPEIFIYIDGFGSQPGDHGVAAEQGGKIIGMAWTRIIPAYGHIDNKTPELAISVLPEYRGQGIGTTLMESLFKLLREHGYSRTSLSVQKDNPAVRLYERLGYKITDEKLDHAGHEDYIMFKELGVALRSWSIEDAPSLTKAINNKKVLDNLRDGIPFPYTEKDAEEFIGATLNADKNTSYSFAITYGNKVIGSIGVFRKDNIHRLTAEMGYYIAEPYWGKGLTTEAVRQMCSYVFENTDIVRIFAEPYAHNTASCRVLEKSGFQFEGTLRYNAIKNGQLLDMRMYAIIKPEARTI